MKTLSLAAIMFSAACLASCGGGGSATATGDIETFDLAAAIDNPVKFDLTEISGDIDLIPLDNESREGLVGGVIRKMAESDGGFYIMDNARSGDADSPVKFFDRTGRFVSTRGRIGRGPGELTSISEFAVDGESDNTYIYGMGKIIAYDAQNRVFATLDSIPNNVLELAYHNDRLVATEDVLLHKAPAVGTPVTFIESFSPDLRAESANVEIPYSDLHGRPFAPDEFGSINVGLITGITVRRDIGTIVVGFTPAIMSDNGRSLVVKRMHNDTVFHYTRGGSLEPAWRADLRDYAVPVEAFGSQPKTGLGRSGMIRTILEGDRYIFVKVAGNGGLSDAQLVIDRDDPSKSFSAVGPDGEPKLFVGGIAITPLYIRDDRLVGYVQALDLVDNAAKITDPELSRVAASLKEDSNPVIVIATLRR
jgi:hypothetical protein